MPASKNTVCLAYCYLNGGLIKVIAAWPVSWSPPMLTDFHSEDTSDLLHIGFVVDNSTVNIVLVLLLLLLLLLL